MNRRLPSFSPAAFFALLLVCASPLSAQNTNPTTIRPDSRKPAGENLAVPLGWKVGFDKPSPDVVIGADEETADIYFVNMTPGWHITTGPAAVFYHPAVTATGVFHAETKIHLFDPGTRNEAFGLIFGGQNLQADNQRYDYFLIRNTGEYLLKRRTGGGTSTIQGWTKSDAVMRYTDPSVSSVENVLAIDAGAKEVIFSINGTTVATFPRADLHADGLVGLRINHGLNVHVSEFKVE